MPLQVMGVWSTLLCWHIGLQLQRGEWKYETTVRTTAFSDLGGGLCLLKTHTVGCSIVGRLSHTLTYVVTNTSSLPNRHPVDHEDVETFPGTFLVYFCIDWYFCVFCCVEKGTCAPGR